MFVGIDVAKAELVVAARPSGERWTVANDERGVRTLVERFQREAPELPIGTLPLGWRGTISGPLSSRAHRAKGDQDVVGCWAGISRSGASPGQQFQAMGWQLLVGGVGAFPTHRAVEMYQPCQPATANPLPDAARRTI